MLYEKLLAHIDDYKYGCITRREMERALDTFIDELTDERFDAMKDVIDAMDEYSNRQERIITRYCSDLAYVVGMLDNEQMKSYVWHISNRTDNID